jgi:hypothetical protein
MAVAFDAVGPSGAGQSSLTTPLAWSHTIGGAVTNSALLAAVSLDITSDAGVTMAMTVDGAAMTSLGIIHANNSTAGFVQVWGKAGLATGARALSCAVSGGTVSSLAGGSLSFSGVNQATPFGTPVTAPVGSPGVATTATATLSSNTSGNIIAGFVGTGSFISSATSPSTSRWINNDHTSNACGPSGGATSPSTGSAVTMAWTITSDWWGVLLVELLGGSGTNAPATLATGIGAALNADTATSNLTSGPRYATASADLGGNQGLWATPQYAQGGP